MRRGEINGARRSSDSRQDEGHGSSGEHVEHLVAHCAANSVRCLPNRPHMVEVFLRSSIRIATVLRKRRRTCHAIPLVVLRFIQDFAICSLGVGQGHQGRGYCARLGRQRESLTVCPLLALFRHAWRSHDVRSPV